MQNYALHHPNQKKKLVGYRKLKNICDMDLAEDLRTMSLQGNTVEDLVTSYNLNLTWFTDKIKDEIRVRHVKE